MCDAGGYLSSLSRLVRLFLASRAFAVCVAMNTSEVQAPLLAMARGSEGGAAGDGGGGAGGGGGGAGGGVREKYLPWREKQVGRGGKRGGARERMRMKAEGYGLQPAMVSSAAAKEGIVSTNFPEHDAAYFHSYSHVGIHEEMIKVLTISLSQSLMWTNAALFAMRSGSCV